MCPLLGRNRLTRLSVRVEQDPVFGGLRRLGPSRLVGLKREGQDRSGRSGGRGRTRDREKGHLDVDGVLNEDDRSDDLEQGCESVERQVSKGERRVRNFGPDIQEDRCPGG